MTRRYYFPELPSSGGLITLADPEAQHATRVMRVQVGDAITLFDGKGHESEAVISQLGRKECHCEAQPPVQVDREPARAIHLGVALPKPDRARELIERLTELGVKTVTPLIAQRTQRAPSNTRIEKLRRGIIEACKQSGRNELLQILPIENAADFLRNDQGGVRLIAHPCAESTSLDQIKASDKVIAAIGPEGGWTDEEFELATESGFKPIDLGKRIYRIETAASVIASVLAS